MDLRSAVRFLEYRLRQEAEQSAYRTVSAQSLALMASGRFTKNTVNYLEIVSEIYGGKTANDTRTAAEIISDTAKKFGVKVR